MVARSSTEAEYRSLALAASEVAWLNSLLGELKIKENASPGIWVDNMSAIALASNPVMHARTKHIELDIHFVRDKVLNKEMEHKHVPTADQIADIFTKPLSKQSFVKLRNKLGIVSLASLGLRGGVREACKTQSEEACNIQLDESSAVVSHVSKVGAREEAKITTKIVHLPAINDQGVAGNLPNKSEDHKSTWRDIVVRGLIKKSV